MKFSKILANASLLAALGGAAFAAQAQTVPACAATNGVITETVTAGAGNWGTLSSNSICTAQPELFQVKIYKIGVCTVTPTAPTSTTAFSAANCTTVFENTAGATVDVTKGITSDLSGTITRPANGNYVAGYVEMAPQFNLKVSKQFSPARMSPKDFVANPSSSTGTYCWSVAGEYMNWGSSQRNTTCGASAGTAGLAVIKMNGFPTSPNAGGFSYTSTVSGQQVGGYLVQADKKLPATGTSGQANGVDRMIGIAAFATPVAINNSTTGFNTQFNVSAGTTLVLGVGNTGNSTPDVQWFDAVLAGPFSIMMTATQ